MDDIKNTITKAAKAIAKASGDAIKTTRYSMAISNEESTLKNLYIEMGKKVCEIYSYGGSMGEFFDEKYKEILASEDKIKDLKQQLDQAKGSRTCPHCGKNAPLSSEFCAKCGKSLLDIQPAINDITNTTAHNNELNDEPIIDLTANYPSKNDLKKCSICGYENAREDKFCLSCGRFL